MINGGAFVDQDFQERLKKEYLIEGQMDNKGIGIKSFSGTVNTAYYELWSYTQIFRLIIIKPAYNLYTSHFVGKSHLILLLIEENEEMKGGMISFKEDLYSELSRVFPHLKPKSIRECQSLWELFVKEHYNQLKE